MAISNKQIRQSSAAFKSIKKRNHTPIEQDFKNYVKAIDSHDIEQNKIDFEQKISEEQIKALLERLSFKQIAKNIYIEASSNVKLTIKPETSLYQLVRLVGHAKYVKGAESLKKDSHSKPDDKTKDFSPGIFVAIWRVLWGFKWFRFVVKFFLSALFIFLLTSLYLSQII